MQADVCVHCEQIVFPPREICPHCHKTTQPKAMTANTHNLVALLPAAPAAFAQPFVAAGDD